MKKLSFLVFVALAACGDFKLYEPDGATDDVVTDGAADAVSTADAVAPDAGDAVAPTDAGSEAAADVVVADATPDVPVVDVPVISDTGPADVSIAPDVVVVDVPAVDVPPVSSCTDHIRNGAETDVDCGGGVCPRCRQDQQCMVPTDCGLPGWAGFDCRSGRCAGTSCVDGTQNGLETDRDCGGPYCVQCAVGGRCLIGSDCLSGRCAVNDAGSLHCF